MMFVGMTLCLPIAYWVDARKAAKKAAGEDASSPLLGDDDDGPVRWAGLLLGLSSCLLQLILGQEGGLRGRLPAPARQRRQRPGALGQGYLQGYDK